MKGRKIPRGAAIALIVGGDVLLLLMGWFLLVSPQRSTAQSIAKSVQATNVQIEQARQPITQPAPPTQPKQPEIETAYLYKLSKAMPMTQDMPNLLLELSQVVRNTGVQLASIAPSPADATGMTSITLAVSGDFYSLTDLLYRLRSLVAVRDGALDVSGRLFSVKSVGFTPDGKGRSLDASITLNTFSFNGTAAAAPAAAAPAPTDTSGTSTGATTTTGETTTSSASADSAIGQP
jgi:Tfp pilus assembly protein PilO